MINFSLLIVSPYTNLEARQAKELEKAKEKEAKETKEEKVKEVLQLEHTLTVEDENYEFPPITFLSEGEKKGIKGGKKAVLF